MPKGVYKRNLKPLAERLAEKIEIQANGCWNYTGHIDRYGYAQIQRGPRGAGKIRVHVAAYQLAFGAVPAGLVVDHLCRNRRCCNPDHLEAVTQKVNLMRGAGLTFVLHRNGVCKRGHPQGPGLTYYRKNGQASRCLECWRVRQQGEGG